MSAKNWALGYEGKALKEGEIIKQEILHSLSSGMQGFVFNLRKDFFKDIKTREALGLAFDFEWSNKNLFYNQYSRTKSFFDNSEFASVGVPLGEELKLLESFKSNLPPKLFTQSFELPTTTGNGSNRENLKKAQTLLKEAGYTMKNGKLYNRLRQCVFGGTSNTLDFLPLDRSGNRRFLPVMVHPEQAEVHILEDEAASRQYIDQLWAETMTIYRRGKVSLRLSAEMNAQLVQKQKEFMPEDTKVGQIQAFLDAYDGDMVCSKLLHHEALGRFEEPKTWEIREINEIMNQSITGWTAYPHPRSYRKYGKQRGWMRGNKVTATPEGFHVLTPEECRQISMPF